MHIGEQFFFQRFVSGLAKLYPELFEEGFGGDSSQHQYNFAKKWKSYTTIVQLAGGDITKFNEVTAEPLEKCLMYLAYTADKVQLEELLHKQAMKKIQHS